MLPVYHQKVQEAWEGQDRRNWWRLKLFPVYTVLLQWYDTCSLAHWYIFCCICFLQFAKTYNLCSITFCYWDIGCFFFPLQWCLLIVELNAEKETATFFFFFFKSSQTLTVKLDTDKEPRRKLGCTSCWLCHIDISRENPYTCFNWNGNIDAARVCTHEECTSTMTSMIINSEE